MNNKIPEYEIKYSKIKNIYIQIKNGKITVKAPKRVSKKEIEKIVEQKTEWIQKTIEKEKSKVFVDFHINEVNTNGDKYNKYNHLSCSYDIPNNICLLELNYTEITSINYYFKINDINELNL